MNDRVAPDALVGLGNDMGNVTGNVAGNDGQATAMIGLRHEF
ncbi:hypothetical protein [Paraburkholderia sp. J41]|nr:hypothetical protein [Paraburkholderia sp. J41]